MSLNQIRPLYRKSPAEIRWIESKEKRFFKPRLSAQEVDKIGFHSEKRELYEGVNSAYDLTALKISINLTGYFRPTTAFRKTRLRTNMSPLDMSSRLKLQFFSDLDIVAGSGWPMTNL
jgi:hypothetical protein